jgi:hypothetical protein
MIQGCLTSRVLLLNRSTCACLYKVCMWCCATQHRLRCEFKVNKSFSTCGYFSGSCSIVAMQMAIVLCRWDGQLQVHASELGPSPLHLPKQPTRVIPANPPSRPCTVLARPDALAVAGGQTVRYGECSGWHSSLVGCIDRSRAAVDHDASAFGVGELYTFLAEGVFGQPLAYPSVLELGFFRVWIEYRLARYGSFKLACHLGQGSTRHLATF